LLDVRIYSQIFSSAASQRLTASTQDVFQEKKHKSKEFPWKTLSQLGLAADKDENDSNK
jgi:hypothetical protein